MNERERLEKVIQQVKRHETTEQFIDRISSVEVPCPVCGSRQNRSTLAAHHVAAHTVRATYSFPPAVNFWSAYD